MFTMQQTFDIVAQHLLTQGVRALTPGRPLSAYRGDGGTKCAIGVLIPDSAYMPVMEGRDVYSEEVYPVLRRLGHNIPVCGALQRLHDLHEVALWETGLRELAETYGLSVQVITDFNNAKYGKLED